MGSQTDCFMTLCAVAAFAKGTTRITNIANQRVKVNGPHCYAARMDAMWGCYTCFLVCRHQECNRIAAMVEEMTKCGLK